MAVTRVTQNMLVSRSVASLQRGLDRLSTVQEQLSSGRRLNRPSDSPTDTTSAMRLRSSLKSVEQYGRNAQDGQARLGLVDQTLFAVGDRVNRARELALQGSNLGSLGQSAREALATEVDQIRADLLDTANTSYLTRPVFGGVTAGDSAYDSTGAYVGVAGDITRRVGDDVRVRVDVDGRDVFGDGATSVFAELDDLSAALRAGDSAGLQTSLSALADRTQAVNTVHANVGAAYKRLEEAQTRLTDQQLNLSTLLSDVENVDMVQATVDVNLQQVAYQAALSATAKAIQPTLLEFLR